jgi:hypothetical protein
MSWPNELTSFGDKLYQLIERKGWGVMEFSRRVKHDQPSISQIRAGTPPPPLKHVDHWADVLGLVGAEREYFLDLAALACCPPRVLRMFEPNHPAARAIQLAIEREQLKVAEPSESYDAKPRSKRD